MNLRLTTQLLLLLGVVVTARADSIDDAEAKKRGVPVEVIILEKRTAELERQNQALLTQIKVLQKQVAGNPERQLAAVSLTQPSTTQPATTIAVATTIPSKADKLQSWLEHLPKDAQPPWDDFSLPHAHKWLMEQLVGKELQATVKIKDIDIRRIFHPGDPDKTVEWDIWVTTDQIRTRALNMDVEFWPATWIPTKYLDPQLGVYVPLDPPGFSWYADSQLKMSATGGKVIIRAGEDVAKLARSWKVGDTIVLSGALEDLDFLGKPPSGKFNVIFKKNVRALEVISAASRQARDNGIVVNSPAN